MNNYMPTNWTCLKWINFLEIYNFPKPPHEKSENLNKQISPSKIEVVIKTQPTNKSPELNGFTGKFYLTF